MSRFAQMVRADLRLADDAEPFDLHRWSVEHADDFWELVFAEAVQRGERGGPGQRGRAASAGAQLLPVGTGQLRRRAAGRRRATRSGTAGADLPPRGWLPRGVELESAACAVEAVAVQLRGLGVGPGDVVGAWLPNAPAAVIAMLATSSLGAVTPRPARTSVRTAWLIGSIKSRPGAGGRRRVLLRRQGPRAAVAAARRRGAAPECAVGARGVGTGHRAGRACGGRRSPCRTMSRWRRCAWLRTSRPALTSPRCRAATTMTASCSTSAPPERPSASSTVRWGCCSSTGPSTCCTATSALATACSSSPPAVG